MKLDAAAAGRLASMAQAAVRPAAWRGAPRSLRDSVFPALAHAQFARLWRANIGSTMAFWMQSVAQGWLVVELTDSAFMLGLLAFFRSIPMLLMSPFGGVLADRLNRARLLLVAQIIMGITALVIGVLVALRWVEIWHLIVSSLVIGATFSINMPARNALVSDLVPRKDVSNAIALNSTTMNSSRVLGPSLAGFLIGVIGIAGVYFVQVAGYVWSTANIVRIKGVETQRRVHGSTLGILREGFVYVVRTKSILALMVLAISPALFTWPVVMLLPAFVKQDLQGGAQDLGVLMSSLGVGALAGSIVVVLNSRFRQKGRALLITALLNSFAIIALGFTNSMLMAGFVIAIAGFFQAVYMALNQTIIQLSVPDRLRGRVLSIFMLSFGLMPLGLLPMSAIAEAVGTPVAMVAGGTVSTFVVLGVMLWGRELWGLEPDAGASEAELEASAGAAEPMQAPASRPRA